VYCYFFGKQSTTAMFIFFFGTAPIFCLCFAEVLFQPPQEQLHVALHSN